MSDDDWPDPDAERGALSTLRRLGLGSTTLRLRSTATASVLVQVLGRSPGGRPPRTAEEVLERVRAAGASVDLLGAVMDDQDADVREAVHEAGWPVQALVSQLHERRPLCTRKVRTLHEAEHFVRTQEHTFRDILARATAAGDADALCRCFVRGIDTAMAIALGDNDAESFAVLCGYAGSAAPAIEDALGADQGADVLIGMVRRTLERIAREGHRVAGAAETRATTHTALCCTALEMLYDQQLLSQAIFRDLACTVSTGVFGLGLAHTAVDRTAAPPGSTDPPGPLAAVVLTALSQHCSAAADAIGRAWTCMGHASHKLEADASVSTWMQRVILKLLGPITMGLILTVFEDRHIVRMLAACCYPRQALVPLLARRGQPVHAELTARLAAALANVGPAVDPTGPLLAAQPSETVVRLRVLLARLKLPRAGGVVLLRLTHTVAVLSEALPSAQLDRIDSVQALIDACEAVGRYDELVDAATLDGEEGITALTGRAPTPVPPEPVFGPWQTPEPQANRWAPAGGLALRELRLDPHPLLAEALIFGQDKIHALVEQLDEVHPTHEHWESAVTSGLDNLDQVIALAIGDGDELAIAALTAYLAHAAEHARQVLGRRVRPQAVTFAGHRALRAAAAFAMSDEMHKLVTAANAALRLHDAGLRPNAYSKTPRDLAEGLFLLLLLSLIHISEPTRPY